jgi:hypothetical protein
MYREGNGIVIGRSGYVHRSRWMIGKPSRMTMTRFRLLTSMIFSRSSEGILDRPIYRSYPSDIRLILVRSESPESVLAQSTDGAVS